MINIKLIFLFFMLLLLTGCFITERERRGVSNIPFNAPPENDGRRTFNGEVQ